MGKKNKRKVIVIDIGYAFSEAATLLSVASEHAINSKNTKDMLKVSHSWMNFGRMLHDVMDEEPEDRPKDQFGFGQFEQVNKDHLESIDELE